MRLKQKETLNHHDSTTMQAKAAAAVLTKRVNENNFIKNDLFKHSFVSSSDW